MNQQLSYYLCSPLSRLLLIALCVLPTALLMGCKPADEPALTTSSAAEGACLDRACPGEEWPKHDHLSESLIKVNGHWYIGPKAYFGGTGSNRAEFEWWEHRPIPGNAPRPPALQAKEVAGKGYDYSVEIFFRSRSSLGPKQGPSGIELLRQAEAEGRLISKTTPREGLEVWRIREPEVTKNYVWYVATQLKGPDGLPPVLACAESVPAHDRCTMGFMWRPGVAADMRFRARHGPDWPEIYQEATRVLQLLRKV